RQEPIGLRVTLAGVGAAGGDLDRPFLGHPDAGAVDARDGGDAAGLVFGGAGPAVLVEEADADPEESACTAGLGLLPAELSVRRIEAAEQPQVVAGIELAAGRRDRRELPDRVAPAELERVQAKLARSYVNHPLGRKGGGVHAHSAVGAGRALAAGQA